MRKYFLCLALTLSLAGLVNGATLLGLYEFEGNGLDSSTAGNNATSVDPDVTYAPGFGGIGQAASFTSGGANSSDIGFVVPINVAFETRPSVTIGGWVNADPGAVGDIGVWGNRNSGGVDRGIMVGSQNALLHQEQLYKLLQQIASLQLKGSNQYLCY